MKRVSENWYMGTADAVYQNIYSIGSERSKHVLLLSGDHIYKMNYELMLRQHQQSGADVTIATILIDPSETRHFGVVEIDRTAESPDSRRSRRKPTCARPTIRSMVSASMGIYLFNTDVLIPVLLKDAEDPNSRHDFGHNVLPRMVEDYKVYSFNFIDENKKEALTGATWERLRPITKPIWIWFRWLRCSTCTTRAGRSAGIMRQYPPAKFVFTDPGRTGEAPRFHR